MKHPLKIFSTAVLLVFAVLCLSVASHKSAFAQAQSKNGSTGITGTVSAPAPKQGASITLPANGQSFGTLPVTVTGICPKGLLVKLFKNNVFAGSVQCTTGSYQLTIDLFNGTNELVARVFDDLDQQGPESNKVTVNFSDKKGNIGTRLSVTSNYAKRGAEPGSILTWPIAISGGNAPFAVSVDWGDKKTPDIISRPFPGEFNIQHAYEQAGIYNVIIKVTDKDGNTAFLQVVGIGNGPIAQDANNSTKANGKNNNGTQTIVVLWWPIILLALLVLIAFWLGRRHQLHLIRRKLMRGDRPF